MPSRYITSRPRPRGSFNPVPIRTNGRLVHEEHASEPSPASLAPLDEVRERYSMGSGFRYSHPSASELLHAAATSPSPRPPCHRSRATSTGPTFHTVWAPHSSDQ